MPMPHPCFPAMGVVEGVATRDRSLPWVEGPLTYFVTVYYHNHRRRKIFLSMGAKLNENKSVGGDDVLFSVTLQQMNEQII